MRRPPGVTIIGAALTMAFVAAPPADAAIQRPAAIRCAPDQANRTLCMIRLILDDLARRGVTGGGVTSIVASSSHSYVVTLPMEERIVQVRYDFAAGGGMVRLTARRETAAAP